MAQIRMSAGLRGLFPAPSCIYRWRCSWLLGNRFLMLVHVGRRTGLRRETVLEVLSYRPDVPEWTVMSGFGPSADWLRNIRVTQDPEVIVGTRHFRAVCRVLDPDVGARVIGEYERRNHFAAPVIRLVLSRLLGWHYRATEADRRRAAAQLPLVAFRPRQKPSIVSKRMSSERRCTRAVAGETGPCGSSAALGSKPANVRAALRTFADALTPVMDEASETVVLRMATHGISETLSRGDISSLICSALMAVLASGADRSILEHALATASGYLAR